MNFGLLGRIGGGIYHGLENIALGNLGGGLLGDLADPNAPQTGLLAANPQAAKPVPGMVGVTQAPNGALQPDNSMIARQRPQATPDQKRYILGQFLQSLGGGMRTGDYAGANQEFRQNLIGQIQAGRQYAAQQQRQQALGAFQQEMVAANGDPKAEHAALMKWTPVIGPQETTAIVKAMREAQAPVDKVSGVPFQGIGADGKPALFMHTESGKIIPVQGFSPQQKFSTDGAQNIYNENTGEIVHPREKTPKDLTWEKLLADNNGDQAAAFGALQRLEKPDNSTSAVDLALRAAAGDKQAAAALKLIKPGPAVINYGTSPDGAANPMIQGIADYSIAPPTPRSSSPASVAAFNQIVDAVKKANPKWDARVYQSAQKTLNDFTSGKSATSINAINTAAGHLGVLKQASDALDTPDGAVFINKIANAYGVQAGSSPLATYKAIVHRLGPEITRAYVGAGGGEADRALAESDFDPSNPKTARDAAISVTGKLFQSKIQALGHQFENGVPGRKFDGFITPEAQGVFSAITRGSVDPRVQAYANQYFGGDIQRAQAEIDKQRRGR